MCVLISVSWKMSGVYIIIRSSKFLHFLRFQLIFSGTLGVLDVLQKDLSNGIACYLTQLLFRDYWNLGMARVDGARSSCSPSRQPHRPG